MIHTTFSLPPSGNHRERYGKGHFYRTAKYRAWLEAECLKHAGDPHLPDAVPIYVTVTIHYDREGRRDIDNTVKTLFDGVTAFGIWADDKQVRRMYVVRGEKRKPGFVEFAATADEAEYQEYLKTLL